MSFEVFTFGNPEAATQLVQLVDDHDLSLIEQEVEFIRELLVDDHDLSLIEQEVEFIRELSGGQDFGLKAVKVNDWNKDLSPWPAPAVFGNEDFGEGAAETLAFLLNNVVPAGKAPGAKTFLGGYSLAGLFALWAGYRTDRFDGIAAASPSIWFPGFVDYMRGNEMRPRAVYLSLGDREERTRNPVMSQVGNAIRQGCDVLQAAGVECVLEWNKGNHFKDADLRTAKAFAWLMR